MPTISVKLPDETKARLDRVAASEGTTPHAVMVGAIEAEIEKREAHSSFVEAALRSRDRMVATGMAYDGDDVIDYLRARSRGEKPARPRLKSFKHLLKPTK